MSDPDKGHHYKRPILGGKQYPYPRRCMTGRPRTPTDPLSEAKSVEFYVPRDEAFSIPTQGYPLTRKLCSMLHGFLPALKDIFTDQTFPLSTKTNHLSLLPRLVESVANKAMDILLLHPSQTSYGDKFFWFRDEEFARHTLAGLNPYSIRLVMEWPLKSKLDPSIYGSPESAITDEIVEQQIKGFMSVDEAKNSLLCGTLHYRYTQTTKCNASNL